GDPARPEHDVGALLAGDVRDVVAVALYLEPAAARALPPDRGAREPEALGLVMAPDVARRDVAEQRRQVVVERQLVGRARAGRDGAGLTGWQHVPHAAAEVDAGRRRRRQNQSEYEGGGEEIATHGLSQPAGALTPRARV